jgi:hypothetical protein
VTAGVRQALRRGRSAPGSFGAGWFDTASLRRDLRSTVADTGAALVVTLALFVWLYDQMTSTASGTTRPLLADASLLWMYWLCQAFGWSALLWAWITVMLGLTRSTRLPGPLRGSVARLERMHRTTSLTTIGLMSAHAFWFFAQLVRENRDDAGWTGRLWSAFVDTFVPGGYDSAAGAVAILIGLLALYLSVPLSLAFYARRSVGPRVWRALHSSIIVVYVLSVWHTLLYGSSVWYDGTPRTTVWLLQLPVAALLLIRLLRPAYRPRSGALHRVGRATGRALVTLTVVSLLLVTATGRDGGRTPGVAGADSGVTQAVVWVGFATFVVVVTRAVVCAHRSNRRRKDAVAQAPLARASEPVARASDR